MLTLLVTHTVALLPRPLASSSLPGNVNFDPLGLSRVDPSLFNRGSRTADDILFQYREAELKHGRLAMLAAVAYPAQETLNPFLADRYALPNLLPQATLSPSLVNGGLTAEILLFLLGLGAGLELYKTNNTSAYPADYKWRVGVGPDDDDRSRMRELQAGEVWNGRVAMMAVLGYTLQEALTKQPVLYFLA